MELLIVGLMAFVFGFVGGAIFVNVVDDLIEKKLGKRN